MLAALCPAAWGQDEKAIYERARQDYFHLVSTPTARGAYQNWQHIIDRFASIYTSDPQGDLAPQCLWWMGRAHAEAYDQFKRQADFLQGVDTLRRLANHFPRHSLADDAQFLIGQFYEKTGDLKHAYLEYLKVTVNYPKGDQVEAAKARLDALEVQLKKQRHQLPRPEKAAAGALAAENTSELAALTELRHWSTPSYTRVVLSLERPVAYTTKLLTVDGEDKPRRLYLDLKGARLTPQAAKPVTIGDGLLRSARADQVTADTVRLALDTQSLGSYKVFTLDNPFRVVVDCFVHAAPAVAAKVPETCPIPPPPPPAKGKVKGKRVPRGQAKELPNQLSLASQLGLCVKRVVLDPGHGGKDPGASFRGLVEKDLTLDLARRTAPKVAKLLGCEVMLTRTKDVYLPLEERTAFANTHEADLFVSIHINAAPTHSLSGIETYFLNLATDEASMRVAARENATTQRSISDLQVILNDLMLNSKINESNRLARAVQKEMLASARKGFAVQDLRVKQAPFYVLIGARMPAVLTEVGFITHPQEHQNLANPAYRDKLAQGLAQGVADYARLLKSPGQ